MKRLFFIGVILTGILFSCQEKNKDFDELLKSANPEETGEGRCLEMTYPLTYIMPDGSTITGNDAREVKMAIKRWYEANPGSKEKPLLQYPVEANFKGKPVTINNAGEMKRMKEACRKDKKPCYIFIYPITYIMPDGSTLTVTKREEMKAVRMWYMENPGYEQRPLLQYPVEVKFEGKVITVNNDNEMKRIKEACKKERKRCFILIYPVTYIMPDGTEITLNSRDDREGRLAIKAWYEANPGNTKKHSLKFPVEIKYKDGTIKNINSREEMRRARADCK